MKKKSFLVFIVILGGIFCTASYFLIKRTPKKETLQSFVQQLRPTTANLSGIDLVAELRDVVYQTVTLKHSYKGARKLTGLENFKKVTSDKSIGHVCGGLSSTYITILRDFGFRTRRVQLITKRGKPTHVATEVFINGQWIATDPTFNIFIRDKDTGRYLGFEELAKGYPGNISYDYGDYTLRKNRALKDYDTPYSDYLHEVWFYNDRFSIFADSQYRGPRIDYKIIDGKIVKNEFTKTK